ncbi:MAG: hypothetical protein LJF06_14465 [Gemmatimonadetes bacterium]|nr:hypothetical protein [Gemmatimonadota bacterium]
MREFTDQEGRSWIAAVREIQGPDYKGRWFFVMAPKDDADSEVTLGDVRWNTERTARRTLETMSVVELRRRLRSALGRASAPVAG